MNPRYIEELSWRFGEVYAACVDRILINLARHFKYVKNGQFNGSWDYQVKKLAEMGQVTRETEAIILSMLGDADGALRDTLEAAVIDGLRGCEPELRKAVEKGYLHGGIPELHPTQMNAFKAYYEQSADKLNLVNTVMLESTQWAYQSTVADIVTRMNTTQGILNVATGEAISGVSSINKSIHDAVQKMVENGITGFIDHGGHKWSPETYVTMDVRATMGNAAREAVFERNKDYGNDLYQVSWHDAARPLCFPWQCKVISSQDLSREVEDDNGNTVHVYAQSETTYGQSAGLFGINCGHYPIPFIPNFSRIREPRQDAEENAKAYQESQQQRYLERRLREEKRDLEVLKAQGATDEEIKLQRQKVRKASDNLDEFCDETGRARRRSREATPIRATWPTDNGPVERYGDWYVTQDSKLTAKAIQEAQEPTWKRVSKAMEENDVLWQGASEEHKKAILGSLEKADENTLRLIEKTIPNAHATFLDEDGTSEYSYGHIKLYTQHYGEARSLDDVTETWWHEYGHFIDDAQRSGSGITRHVDLGTFDYDVYGMTDSVTGSSDLYGKAVVKDVNEFLKRSNLDDRFEMQMDSYGSKWLHYKGGEAVDLTTISFDDQRLLSGALDKWQKDITGRTKAINYLYEQGMPKQPEWSDYYESYRTPKRQIYRTRERFKGAERAYQEANQKYWALRDDFEATHDMKKLYAEQARLAEIANINERKTGAATDTFDEGTYGMFLSAVIGGHTPQYYQTHKNGKEGAANVFMTTVLNDPFITKTFKDLCPNVYSVFMEAMK